MGDLEVSHVTLTINAVDPEIGARVYSWIRDGKRMYRGLPAAELLWQRQKEAVGELKKQGVAVKINTIIVPGVNDGHAVEIARTVKELGADIINCVPLYPVPGTPFAGIPSPDGETIRSIRAAASAFLPIMEHCTRCRADAVGLLGEKMPAAIELHLLHCAASGQDEPAEISAAATEAASEPADPAARPHVAVATLEGVLVNQHLGEAMQFAVFTREKGEYRLVETRQAPPPGGAEQRWHALADTLHDCRALLVASAGQSPRSALQSRGIRVLMMEGLIEEGLEAVYRGTEILRSAPPTASLRQRFGLWRNRHGLRIRSRVGRAQRAPPFLSQVGWAERSESHHTKRWDSLRSAHPTVILQIVLNHFPKGHRSCVNRSFISFCVTASV